MFRSLALRPLLRSLTLLACAVPLGTFAADTSTKWEKEIAAYEQRDRESPPPKGAILFAGSSSIRLWSTLGQDFPQHRVLNRGVGGSQIADATYFAERIVFPYEPRMIVLYAGGNDLNAGKSPEQVVADFRAFVEKVRARLPAVEIAYISIAGNPARWAQVEKVKAVNARIAELTQQIPRMKFINVFPHMLADDGLPRPDIFREDRLHMNAAGYKIWASVVASFLPGADR